MVKALSEPPLIAGFAQEIQSPGTLVVRCLHYGSFWRHREVCHIMWMQPHANGGYYDTSAAVSRTMTTGCLLDLGERDELLSVLRVTDSHVHDRLEGHKRWIASFMAHATRHSHKCYCGSTNNLR